MPQDDYNRDNSIPVITPTSPPKANNEIDAKTYDDVEVKQKQQSITNGIDPNEMLLDAISSLDSDKVKRAIQLGADPNYKRNPNSATLSSLLSFKLSRETDTSDIIKGKCIIDTLIEAGASRMYFESMMTLLASNDYMSPICELLVNHGFDPKTRYSENMLTPLETAEMERNERIIRLLHSNGVEPLYERHRRFLRFVGFASDHDLLGMRNSMLNNTEFVNELTRNGRAALTEAAFGNLDSNLLACVSFLLDNGANPNIKEKDGTFSNVALHKIVIASSWPVKSPESAPEIGLIAMDKLIKAGADVSLQDEKGKTALHLASEWNGIEPAILLIASGVDVDITDNNGKKAIDYAKSDSMIRLLETNRKARDH